MVWLRSKLSKLWLWVSQVGFDLHLCGCFAFGMTCHSSEVYFIATKTAALYFGSQVSIFVHYHSHLIFDWWTTAVIQCRFRAEHNTIKTEREWNTVIHAQVCQKIYKYLQYSSTLFLLLKTLPSCPKKIQGLDSKLWSLQHTYTARAHSGQSSKHLRELRRSKTPTRLFCELHFWQTIKD